MAETPVEEGSVIGFKGGQAGVEQVAFGDDHDVEPLGDLIATKNLSNQSFSSVSINRAAEFSRRGNPQPSHPELVWQDEHRAVAAMGSDAPRVDLLVFDAAANPFVRAESHRLPAASFQQKLSTRKPRAEKLL